MDISKHIVLTSASIIEELCQPLKENFGITFFTFMRIYRDGSHCRLSNHMKWTNYYYERNYYQLLAYRLTEQNGIHYLLWPGLEKTQLIIGASQYFNIDHGIVFIEQHHDYKELICFASTSDNYSIINWYTNNVYILQHFIFFFREKAKKLIEKSGATKNIIYLNELTINRIKINNLACQKQEFIQKTPIKKYLIVNQNGIDVTISRRELECLALLMNGFSAKKIADKLYLSKRTIETHIEHIKNKFNCDDRLDLLLKLKNYQLENYLKSFNKYLV